MNNISDRIEKILDYYQINSGELAKKIGVQKSSISHLLSGRNKPSFLFLSKLIKAFPEINIKWFLTGAGNMLEKDKTKEEDPLQKTSPLEEINDVRLNDNNTESIEKIADGVEHKQNEEKKLIKNSNNQKSETGTINKPKQKINQIIMVYDNDTFKILTKAEE